MFDKFENRLTLKGDLVLKTALRIGASRSIEPIGTDLPVVKDVKGLPYIPGSSFKGVLRSSVEQFVRALEIPDKKGVCNPVVLDEWCITSGDIEDLKNKAKNDEHLTKLILQNTCLVCQLFGSSWLASRIQIKDLLVDEDLWFDQFQIRNGVAIDRDTETAKEGALYNFEVVPADTRFKCEICVENAKDWQLGMLMIGLAPFENGEIALGGGTSRGLGQVEIEWKDRKYFALNGNLDQYFQFIQGKYSGENIDEKDEKGENLIDSFLSAFKKKIRCLKTEEKNAQKTNQ